MTGGNEMQLGRFSNVESERKAAVGRRSGRLLGGSLLLALLSLRVVAVSTEADAATLNTVRTGTLYFSASGSSSTVNNRTVTIEPVNRNKSILFFTVMPANNIVSAEGAWIRCSLISDTQIHCNRSLPGRHAPGQMKVNWRVVEFKSGVNVQHLMADCSGVTTTISLPAPVAAMEKSFVLFSGTAPGANQQIWRTADLSSASSVQVQFTEKQGAGARGCQGNYAVQVVEHEDVNVTRGTSSIGQGASSVSVSGLSPVDPSKTLLLYSWQLLMTYNDHNSARNAQIVGKLNSSSIDFSRGYKDGQIPKIRWQRIEFSDGSWVQHVDVTLAAGVDLLTDPCVEVPLIKTVVPAKSAILTGAMQSGPNGFKSVHTYNDPHRYLPGLDIASDGASFSVCRSNVQISVTESKGHVAVIQFDQCGNGVVDAGEQCDPGAASANDCCTDQCMFETPSFSCRHAVSGGCDQAESCTGTSADCPVDAVEQAGIVCRSAHGECNPEEVCDGVNAECPADVYAPAGTACSDTQADCFVALCSASGVCQQQGGFVAAGTECRASAGDCDVAETCDGVSGYCPHDARVAADTTCRAAAGECDVAEVCDGASVNCPIDSFELVGTLCRAVSGDCDVAESCTGQSASCPADAVLAAGTVCRAATGECDAAEVCSGLGIACPNDHFVPDGQACTDDGLVCNGSAACSNGSCVAALADLDCNDGDPCTADTCNEPGGCNFAPIAGCCQNNADCDDGNACTQDSCNGNNTCANVAIEGCCSRDSECDDGDSCTKDQCNIPGPGLGGSCGAAAITGCCKQASDCDDGNSCTHDSCENSKCVSAGIANCCQQNADCDDGNSCTENTCDVATGACTAAPIEECCLSDGDCGDKNVCTVDTCDLQTNTCTFTEDSDCCAVDADCDDNNPCTEDVCDAATRQCKKTDVEGCCQADSDCDDGQACTADSCDLSNNTCTQSPVSSCCDTAADCDDGNSCTLDSCSNNQCQSAEMPNCCQRDADCDDGSACTTDRCDVGSGTCDHSVTGTCCQTDADCNDGNSCMTNTCDVTSGQCRTDAVPNCCQSDSECDDGNSCTTDSCDLKTNTCSSLEAETGCCLVDADCNDGLSCTADSCNPLTNTCENKNTCFCGNGSLDEGETCDTAVAEGQPGACPAECNDGDSCTTDTLEGNGCNVECRTTSITSMISGDGCCPAGATYEGDADCEKACGNGKVDPGEACDTAIAEGKEGACPTSCDDGKSCTEDKMVGSECDARCEVVELLPQPDAIDGCCPAGMTLTEDADCLPLCEADVEGDCVQPCGPDNTDDSCADLCQDVECAEDEVCIMGSCRVDQCKDVVCPEGSRCEEGRCYGTFQSPLPADSAPAPTPPAGCDCTVASGQSHVPSLLMLALLALGLIWRQRRRTMAEAAVDPQPNSVQSLGKSPNGNSRRLNLRGRFFPTGFDPHEGDDHQRPRHHAPEG